MVAPGWLIDCFIPPSSPTPSIFLEENLKFQVFINSSFHVFSLSHASGLCWLVGVSRDGTTQFW